jgi:hypothetical protein
MTDRTATPHWTDHNVSDPGITLLRALVYVLGAVLVTAGSAVVLRRRRHALAR